ncbi:hypothetical protein BG005_003511, partial [Podila minutissima]
MAVIEHKEGGEAEVEVEEEESTDITTKTTVNTRYEEEEGSQSSTTTIALNTSVQHVEETAESSCHMQVQEFCAEDFNGDDLIELSKILKFLWKCTFTHSKEIIVCHGKGYSGVIGQTVTDPAEDLATARVKEEQIRKKFLEALKGPDKKKEFRFHVPIGKETVEAVMKALT